MRQHICYGGATCTNEAETQVGGRGKYEVSPSSANLHGLVPPTFSAPIPPPNEAILILLKGTRSTEIKYLEK